MEPQRGNRLTNSLGWQLGRQVHCPYPELSCSILEISVKDNGWSSSFQSDNSLRYVGFPFTRVSEYVFFGVSRDISRIRKPKRTQALMAVDADLRQYNGARLHPGTGGPVLLLSMRKLADLVAYSLAYEFEDTVAELTGADRVDAGDWGCA